MVVGSVFAPVIHDRGQIEIPTLYFRLTVTQQFLNAWAHRDGRHSRRRANGLLRAAETDIDALPIHVKRDSGQRRHAVHNEKRSEFIRDLAEGINLGHDACGCLPVRQSYKFDLASLTSTAHILRVNSPSKRS